MRRTITTNLSVDDAHDPEATRTLSAIVAPLAADQQVTV